MSELRLACPPRLDQETGRELFKKARMLQVSAEDTVILDLSLTTAIDTRGGASLVEISDYLRRRQAHLRWEGQTGQAADFLKICEPALRAAPVSTQEKTGTFEELGDTAIRFMAEFWEFLDLCVDALYWTLLAPFEGRGFRWGSLIDEIFEMGVRAVRIVCLMNFLLGLIIAMLSAKQVENFGVQILVADLIVIGFARELAAVMTTVVVSARSGAAIAAELATMKVQEEIDALRGMGLNVAQFLVAPKLLAMVIVLPCLWALGMLSGIAGGCVWGILILRFQPSVWLTETQNATHFGDLFQGAVKTLVFAVMITLIGCHNGLRVTGGSRGVGLMTTRAVVMDIFFMICIDIVFATLFYYIL